MKISFKDQMKLPNPAFNRTFCGMRALGFISLSPKARMPQNAG